MMINCEHWHPFGSDLGYLLIYRESITGVSRLTCLPKQSVFPGTPTTIKTMGDNITTIAYLRVLIIEIGSTIIFMVVEAQGCVKVTYLDSFVFFTNNTGVINQQRCISPNRRSNLMHPKWPWVHLKEREKKTSEIQGHLEHHPRTCKWLISMGDPYHLLTGMIFQARIFPCLTKELLTTIGLRLGSYFKAGWWHLDYLLYVGDEILSS